MAIFRQPRSRVQAGGTLFKVFPIGDSFSPLLCTIRSEGDTAMTPPQNALVQNTNVGELCKSVLEEEDSSRIELLLDELYRALDECELLASLL